MFDAMKLPKWVRRRSQRSPTPWYIPPTHLVLTQGWLVLDTFTGHCPWTHSEDLDLTPLGRKHPRTRSAPPPGVELNAYLKSISHRCHLYEEAFVWKLTKQTIHLLLVCLQGAAPAAKTRGAGRAGGVPGYLAHKKPPPLIEGRSSRERRPS